MKYLLFICFLCAVGCEILEEDISGREVSIVSPADRITVSPGDIDFRWQGVEAATGYEFTVVSPSFDAAERLVIDTVIYADSLGRRFGCRVALDEGEYEWSVRGFNPAYETRTAVRSLRVQPGKSDTE